MFVDLSGRDRIIKNKKSDFLFPTVADLYEVMSPALGDMDFGPDMNDDLLNDDDF